MSNLDWIDGFWTGWQRAFQQNFFQIDALNNNHLWDWSASNAALAGGVASGLASGFLAYVIFSLGLRAERKKHVQELSRREADLARSEEKKQSELAFSAAFKMSHWLQFGKAICRAVRHETDAKSAEVAQGAPLAAVVRAIPYKAPIPERLAISQVSFLASGKEVDLINEVFELEAWAYHVMRLSQEFSDHRREWDAWAPANIDNSARLGPDGSSTMQFVGPKKYEADIRILMMNDLLRSIQADDEHYIGKYQKVLDRYIKVCRDTYPNYFPSIGFEWKETDKHGSSKS
jgi:hypothetical protein